MMVSNWTAYSLEVYVIMQMEATVNMGEKYLMRKQADGQRDGGPNDLKRKDR